MVFSSSFIFSDLIIGLCSIDLGFRRVTPLAVCNTFLMEDVTQEKAVGGESRQNDGPN